MCNSVAGCQLVIPELNACFLVVACNFVFFLFCTVYSQINEEYIFFILFPETNTSTID